MSKKEKNEIPKEDEAKIVEEIIEKSHTEILEEKCSELNDRYLRTLAEYDNFRKRSMKERDAIYPEAKANTIMEFLPVADNFKRALGFECTDSEFKKGMEMICNLLDETFTKLGVTEIGKVGEPFNPEWHNAVMHIEDPEVAESTVVEIFQTGYKMGDRVLRYAMVKVAN